MAIALDDEYPGQVDTSDLNYPHGKPRNDSALDSGDGTPLEERWLQDLQGIKQHLLDQAGITPSGTPDHRNVSQYGQALRELFERPVCTFEVTGTFIADDAPFSLAKETGLDSHSSSPAFYTITGGNAVQLPTNLRWFYVAFHGTIFSTLTTDPTSCQVDVGENGFAAMVLRGVRWSTNTSHGFPIAGGQIMSVGRNGNPIQVINRSGSNLTIADGKLTIVAGPKVGAFGSTLW